MKATVLRTVLLCLALLALPAAAKDFSFQDIQGNTLRLTDYRGKWVLVNFWATWCPPCQQETPDLIALHNAHKDSDLVVIGVALDSKRPAVANFIAKYGITYPIVIGSYTMAEYEVSAVEALPTSFLYDPAGKLVSYQEGAISREEIETYLLLKKKNNTPAQ